jgi:hypothetical protein
MAKYEIMYERPSDQFGPSKVLGGPYEEKEARQLMGELADVHTEDNFWLEEVA